MACSTPTLSRYEPNIKTFLTNIREVIKGNAQATPGHLIALLNPKIQGWVNYHQHVSSKRTFGKIDRAIFNAVWQWAKRRHPTKGRRWIRQKHFRSEGARSWVFYGELDNKTVWLRRAANTPIKRRPPLLVLARPLALSIAASAPKAALSLPKSPPRTKSLVRSMRS
jgi:RNA-directed DNA polymerase